jgi:hypothetical protein
MPFDPLDPFEEPREGQTRADERAEKLLEESDGHEDPDSED